MPVDPQIQALLDRGTGVPATHTLPVAEARRQYEARIALMAPPPQVAKVVEHRIDGPEGPLALRIYTPEGSGPNPVRYTVLDVVSTIVPAVRPWKEPLNTITFCLPVATLAILIAFSSASAPEFAK